MCQHIALSREYNIVEIERAPRLIISLYFREEEGKDLLGKRTMDFKVSYLDQGLASSYSEFGGETAAPTSGKNINPR